MLHAYWGSGAEQRTLRPPHDSVVQRCHDVKATLHAGFVQLGRHALCNHTVARSSPPHSFLTTSCASRCAGEDLQGDISRKERTESGSLYAVQFYSTFSLFLFVIL